MEPGLSVDLRDTGEAKAMLYAALCKDLVRCISRFDFAVYCNVHILYWAIPDVVISFTMADKATSILPEYIPDFLFILSHKQLPCLFFLL